MRDETAKNAEPSNVIKLHSPDVIHRNSNATSAIQRVIQSVVRETRRSKLNYEQLKYCFREVRRIAGVNVTQKRESLIELPTDEQLERFYSVIKDPVHRLMFKVLETSGLRVSELCNMHVARIDFKQQQAFVSKGKGGKDRLILLNAKLCMQLQLYLNGRNNKYIFESIRHDKFSPRQVQRLFERYSKLSNLDIWPHLMRHRFATRLAQAGLSEDQRKILCGHSKNSDAQQVYTHLALSNVKTDALKAIDQWEV